MVDHGFHMQFQTSHRAAEAILYWPTFRNNQRLDCSKSKYIGKIEYKGGENEVPMH